MDTLQADVRHPVRTMDQAVFRTFSCFSEPLENSFLRI
jgi:hypothetical protein